MPYIVENDVDSYGFLTGADGDLAASIARHPWPEPFPAVEHQVAVSWEPGSLGIRPNILRHNLIGDFVVDDRALEFFIQKAGPDIKAFARLLLDGTTFSALQVTSVLDVVGVARSVPSEYSWADFSYPYISPAFDSVIENRIFRVPNRGFGLPVFVGNEIKRAFESEGLTGWVFNEVLG
jgi:hypothetical protein